jgi:hypothetical protein
MLLTIANAANINKYKLKSKRPHSCNIFYLLENGKNALAYYGFIVQIVKVKLLLRLK